MKTCQIIAPQHVGLHLKLVERNFGDGETTDKYIAKVDGHGEPDNNEHGIHASAQLVNFGPGHAEPVVHDESRARREACHEGYNEQVQMDEDDNEGEYDATGDEASRGANE